MKEKTETIRLTTATKKAIDKLKIYKRETYEDLIKRIVIDNSSEAVGGSNEE